MDKYVYRFAEGGRGMADLLGGKGAGLAEMTRTGLDVPPGFTTTTEACRAFFDTGAEPAVLHDQVTYAWNQFQDEVRERFTADEYEPIAAPYRVPLLVTGFEPL